MYTWIVTNHNGITEVAADTWETADHMLILKKTLDRDEAGDPVVAIFAPGHWSSCVRKEQ